MNKRIRFAGVIAGLLLLAVVGVGASAASDPTQKVGSPAGGGPAALQGGAITAVTVATSAPNMITNSTVYVDIPGMQATMTVTTSKALILARFSAESECTGTVMGWCSVRILVDGVEAAPGDGTDFAFDSTSNGKSVGDNWQSHSMDRSIVVNTGTHFIDAQWAVVTSNKITFWTGERSLTVERADF